ncbi:MAG: hypothetical protein EOP04_20775 [Proteobacteria bacterium]|nr:MAG: hypothetical protein EOP04_20775 [Pseudomonadota bacterium]
MRFPLIPSRPSFIGKLKDKGFGPSDIPKAIFIHELLGMFMLALTWSLCYFYPLSQSPMFVKPLAVISSKMPAALAKSLEANKFLSSPIGVSYVESSCLRKLIRPLTLPGKVFLTFKLVELLHKFDRSKAATLPTVDDTKKLRPSLPLLKTEVINCL